MSSPHRSRFTTSRVSGTAFALFAFALLLALPAQSSAQGQAAADIQLAADQTLSTATTVEAQGGQTVVIELFGTGFTDAVALQATIEVDDATAISGAPTLDGNPTYFPPSPFAGVEQNGTTFTANFATLFGMTGPTLVSSNAAKPQYLGQISFTLATGFQGVTFTVTKLAFGGSITIDSNLQLSVANPFAGPKTFGADLDPAPGNQGVLSRRANPNVRFPVQTFASKLSGVTGIEIYAQVDPDAPEQALMVFDVGGAQFFVGLVGHA